jgi:hypothetical protein
VQPRSPASEATRSYVRLAAVAGDLIQALTTLAQTGGERVSPSSPFCGTIAAVSGDV